MKLDTKALRYLTPEDWRVLTAAETGSKNHEVVPTPLIVQLSGLRSANSGVQRCISTLAKAGLIAKVKGAKYDGYRLTYGGLDYLALHALLKQSSIYSVGNQIGTGKESDIFVVADSTGRQHVLKIHRLGRISFRTVKSNRDYTSGRGSRHKKNAAANAGSYWMYMSKLAALKEFTFMKKLWEEGVPVPEPKAHNRHVLVMGLVDGFPLRQIKSVPDPRSLYAELLGLVVKLAGYGLIHGDFNEFNIMIKEEEEEADVSNDDAGTKEDHPLTNDGPQQQPHSAPSSTTIKLIPVIIDFPQMTSIDHPDAEVYFNRDVDCIKRFFERRFRFVSDDPGPTFEDAKKAASMESSPKRLDIEAEASGFSRQMAKELEGYMRDVGAEGMGRDEEGNAGEEEEDEDDSQDEDDALHEEVGEPSEATDQSLR